MIASGTHAVMPPQEFELDLIIIGGGIAGLWTLKRALDAGYSAILLEKGELGGGQSVQSQGIVHGGGKYTLGGPAPVARSLVPMPERWRRCLAGQGEIDLSEVKVLSDRVHVWSLDPHAAGVGFLAGQAGAAGTGPDDTLPAPFAHPDFRGRLLQLDEPVLDMPSLCQALSRPVAEHLFQVDAASLEFSAEEGRVRISDPRSGLSLRAARVAVTAGSGMAELAGRLRLDTVYMQHRPLHMVAVRQRAPAPEPIYGHLAGPGGRPMLTVTTHPLPGGGAVRYLGGQLAEEGIGRDADSQIEAAGAALRAALPWLPEMEGDWLSLPIDRAEPRQAGFARPDGAFVQEHGAYIVGWPTKLALAPDLADRVLAMLPPPAARRPDLAALTVWPRPSVAKLPWERHFACS